MVYNGIGDKGPSGARWSEVEVCFQPGKVDRSVPSRDVQGADAPLFLSMRISSLLGHPL